MPVIEYFYSAFSAYAYLGSARLMEIAKAAGRRIEHRPMDWHRVVEANGPGSTNRLTRARQSYFSGREIERWSELRGAPVMEGFPTFHDRDMTLPNCLLIAAAQAGADIDRLSHALLEAHWRDDADIADRATLERLARRMAVDPLPLLAAATTAPVVQVYRANSEEAIERSVFGSPTYFVDGDMFYGQDRLEMVERALERRFAGRWPREGRGAQRG